MVRIEASRMTEFSSRETFHKQLGSVVSGLNQLEKRWFNKPLTPEEKYVELHKFGQSIFRGSGQNNKIKDPERLLFANVFNLFSFKHRLTEEDRTLSELQTIFKKGKIIGFLGPLGVGKSTLAEWTAIETSNRLATIEPYKKNPFWNAQQKEPKKYDEFMLRSQVFFLLFNISADIRSDIARRVTERTMISDTSILTDILMWVEWYRQNNRFDEKEYKTYLKLVNLFKDIIPRPDLLVVVNADSSEHLHEAVNNRSIDDKERCGEAIFTEEELQLQMNITQQLLEKTLPHDWKTRTFTLTVNPLEFDPRNLNQEYLDKQIKLITEEMERVRVL